MKKIFQIIIGLGIGFVTVLFHYNATGVGILQEYIEEIPDIRWADVFGPRKDALDLYYLIYNNLSNKPEDDALRDTAQKFGFSISEAKNIVDGSITALYHNPSRNYSVLTMEQAYNEYQAIINYYKTMRETYALSEEMNAIAMTSEIFSNGDLSDSGFDLVDDFRRMQKLLFEKKTPIITGQFYPFALSSPNPENISGYDAEKLSPFADREDVSSDFTGGVDGESSADGMLEQDDLDITDDSGDGLILDRDPCLEDDAFADVLSNFEDELALKEEERQIREDSGLADPEEEDKLEFLGEDRDVLYLDSDIDSDFSVLSEDGSINPARRGSWGNSFCPALTPVASRSGDGYQAVVGETGFSSLRNFSDFMLSDGMAVGAGAFLGSDRASLRVAVCFSIEWIYKTYSTYHPDATCIKCEVDRINDALSSVLSHSLIPSKVTGNYMESTKCKDAFSVLPSMNIIAISAPISTPMNFDLISEKNIFQEWNSFIEEHRPFLSDAGKIPINYENSLVLENAPPYENLTSVMLNMQNTMNRNIAESVQRINNMSLGDDLSNRNLYAGEFFQQIKQFHQLFMNFQTLIKDSVDACRLVEDKPDIN